MEESKADLILHPIRMRIIQALLPEGNRTTQQLAERISNVPQATLYRHLNTLRKAGLIHVVEERKVRGTIEKVYALARHAADVTPADITQNAAGEHMELFLKFVASLIGDFGSYVEQKHYNLVEDGVSFRQLQLLLNDEEYMKLLHDTRALMQQHVSNGPGEGRRFRMLSTIVIPEKRTITSNEPDKEP